MMDAQMNNDYCVYLERRQVKQYKQVEVCRDVYRVTGPAAEEIRKLVVGIVERHYLGTPFPGSSVDLVLRGINGLFGHNCAAGYDPETGEAI
jgi:hypothetical protein